MNTALIADLLAEADLVGSPGVIRMPVRYYMELRSKSRTALDVTTNTELLRGGILGTIFGVPIKVHKRGLRDFIVVEDDKKKSLVHICELGGIHKGAPDACSNPECIVKYVMVE